MVWEKALDRPAQQRRIVSRHRCHDENARLRTLRRMFNYTFEVQEAAERSFPDRGDVDRHALAADQSRSDVPFGLSVAAGRALEQFACRRYALAELRVRERIGR